MSRLIILLSLCGFAATVYGAFGGCPKYKPKKLVHTPDLAGEWFLWSSTGSPFNLNLKCQQVDVISNQDGKMRLNIQGVIKKSPYMVSIHMLGWSILRDGVSSFTLFSTLVGETDKYNVQVLDTDYTNWAIIYSCTQSIMGIWHKDYAGILTRTRYETRAQVPHLLKLEVQQVVSQLRLKYSRFKAADNGRCPLPIVFYSTID